MSLIYPHLSIQMDMQYSSNFFAVLQQLLLASQQTIRTQEDRLENAAAMLSLRRIIAKEQEEELKALEE